MVYIRSISSVKLYWYCASINIHTAPHNYRTAYTQHVSYDTFIEHAKKFRQKCDMRVWSWETPTRHLSAACAARRHLAVCCLSCPVCYTSMAL